MNRTFAHCLLRSSYAALLVTAMFASVPAEAHSGTANRVPWDVCQSATLGDTCEFVDHHKMVNRGTCRSSGGALLCVRHKPLISVNDYGPSDAVSASTATLASVGGLACGGLLVVGAMVRRQTPTHGE